MKTKLLLGIAILVIGAVAVFNVNYNSHNNSKAIFSFSGVEVLAQETSQPSCSCTKKCGDGQTSASCTGYVVCRCHSSLNYVECDNVKSYC